MYLRKINFQSGNWDFELENDDFESGKNVHQQEEGVHEDMIWLQTKSAPVLLHYSSTKRGRDKQAPMCGAYNKL